MSKAKEVNVEDLLNNYDEAPKVKKEAKKTQQSDWAEDEEPGFTLGFTKSTGGAKNKGATKKNTVKGWADTVDDNKPQTQAASSDFSKIQQDQETKKKKIFQKPTGETKAPQKVVLDEFFPSLGEEVTPEQRKKPEPTPTQTQPVTDSKPASTGPRRFVNTAKKEKGEHFVELDPTLVEKIPEKPENVEKVEKVDEEKTEKVEKVEKTEKTEKPEKPENGFTESTVPREKGIFQRRTQEPQQEVTPPVDSKFKFGGEGPKRFTNKISFKREEEKSEQELLRLQKEREIEEKLDKEREELAKKREEAAKKKENRDKDQKRPFNKDENKPESGEKAPSKFTKSRKDGDKETAPLEKVAQGEKAVVNPLVEEKTLPAKEKIEVNGTLSTKGWGEGAILKKPVKK